MLTGKFSPAEALAVWRAAEPAELDQKLIAGWTLRCLGEGLGGMPSAQALRAVARSGLSEMLGREAVRLGLENGWEADPGRSGSLIEAVMDACDLAGVEFGPAAASFAKQAHFWQLRQPMWPNPYATAFAGEQLLDALAKAWTLWESRRIGEEAAGPAAGAKSRPSRI